VVVITQKRFVCSIFADDAYLVKWTTTTGDNPHTVEVALAAGFDMKKADTNIYFSGAKSATCKVTLGTDEEDDLSNYTAPAGAKAIMRGALTATGFSPTFTGGNKGFSWYVKKGEENSLSGSVTNHATATEISVTGMNEGTWVIWVKNADGVQKI